jgi:hypothetical protein
MSSSARTSARVLARDAVQTYLNGCFFLISQLLFFGGAIFQGRVIQAENEAEEEATPLEGQSLFVFCLVIVSVFALQLLSFVCTHLGLR